MVVWLNWAFVVLTCSPNVSLEEQEGVIAKAEVSAKAQIAKGWEIKRSSFKKDDATRVKRLKEAIQCFSVVAERWPNDGAACCEASFRIGEIHRSMGALQEAEAAFTKCLEHKEGGRFRARGLLELGHARRRVEDVDGALTFYNQVVSEHPDENKTCSQALTWNGTVQLDMGDAEKGIQVLLGFEERFPEFPEAAIRNIDKVALWYIKQEKVDDARALVIEASKRFRAKAPDDEKKRAKIERALSKMKSPSKL